MSAIRSRSAAALVAAAIVDVAAESPAERRLYLERHFGIDPADVLDALLERASGEPLALDGSVQLATVAAGAATLIPYLVVDAADAGRNRGSQGFAAWLRTEFSAGAAPGESRVLLILDPNAVETVRSAADDLALAGRLAWPRLCTDAASYADGKPAAPLARAVAEDLAGRRGNVHLLEAFADFCATQADDAMAAGRDLHQLGYHVSDPGAGADPARIARGARWRRDLARWSGPGEDLGRRLERALRPGAPGIERVLAAVGPLGLDYAGFTLDDLTPATAPEPLRFRRPLQVRGATSRISSGDALAVWVPASSSEIAFRTAGDLQGGESLELRWSGSARSTVPVEADGWATARVQHSGWRFAAVALTRGGRTLDEITAAFWCSDGTWFPVEAGFLIEPDNAAFRVEDEPRVLAVAPGGGVLGPADVDPLPETSELSDEAQDAVARFHGEAHSLPVLVSGQDVPETDGRGAGGDGDGDGDGDGAGEEDEVDGAGGELPRAREVQPSPVHAYLTSVRANPDPEERDVTFSAAAGERSITVGGEAFDLADQKVGRFEGLAAEELILGAPQHWAFTLTVTAEGAMRIGGDPVLERLSLSAIAPAALQGFQRARRDFFAALRPHGSVYTLATGAAGPEAIAYVERYADLLNAIPDAGRYQPEFDRVLLMDAVVDTATGDRYLAPTNPITVAFYLTFAGAARAWSAEAPGQPLESDIRSVRPDFFLPMFETSGTWYEVTPCGPFLWRQFEPVRERGAVPADEARLIDERMRFFLDVHPAYADARQTVSVSVLEPGSGAAIVAALRRFYRRDYGRDDFAQYIRPRLSIQVLTETGELPKELEALLAGGDSDEAIDPFVRTRVRISSARINGGPGMPFSHLTFVFRTPAARSPQPQDMTRRAPSLYAGGLATSPGRVLEEGANERRFGWGTFASATDAALPGGGPAAGALPGSVRRTLELVGGQPRELMQPGVSRMATTTVRRDFMPEEYAHSVWVIHLDHVLGLEAFARSGEAGERYLIEYEDVAGAAGLGGVTATARVAPYRAALTQALRDLDRLEPEGLEKILHLLNAVSGRWALRLLRDGPDQIRERIGTVAAIAMLDQLDGCFDSTGGTAVLLPLDEVFRRLPEIGIPRPQSRSTDDLLVVWVPDGGGPLMVRARLIEVKYRSRGGPELAEARQEIENTEQWLSDVFNAPGPGRLFRARDLAEMLRSSASRGAAFGLLPSLDRERLESALSQVAAGDYELRFEFWSGERRLIGDVVSVELESRTGASRSALPGAGDGAGLVRLGRDVLNALAGGHRLEVPDGWERPHFDPPKGGSGNGGAAPPEPGPPGSSGQHAERSRPPAAPAGAARTEAVEAEVRRLARELDTAVLKYGLELEPFQPSLAQVGPSVIRFRARPLGRQSLDGVARRSADLGREVGAPEGVIVSQEPYFLTVDIPRRSREVVRFSDYTSLLSGDSEPGALNFLVGMAPSGEVRIADLARLPHLLIAGATGSGKSVFLRSLLCSLLEQNGALELSILLVDPKQVDFMPFEDLPHLVDGRIIFDPGEAVAILGETIGRELERRRPILKRAGVTSALEFYEAGGSRHELPQMVVVVDEFADLASTLGRGERAEFMSLIQRYGQLTRAFGIYLVLATQRPSVQVITGDIKANLTARVALKVQASQDSVTILGHGGAERLRDKGDLLFEHAGGEERLQGFMVTPPDVAGAVLRWSRP
jgi:DNA translocase FtsK/SpoIIIE-like protein